MAEYIRDALLAELRRALDAWRPEESDGMFVEVERWIPTEGSLPHGPVTRPVAQLFDLSMHALGAAFSREKATDLMAALNSLWTPWWSLAEATAWCAGRDVARLRHPEFAPQPAQPGAPGIDWFLWGNDTQRVAQMENVVRQRRHELQGGPARLLQPDVPAGRLLVYWPDLQASDGSSQIASDGFFDIFDAPPWDTWVHYEPVHHFLVSWVPLPLVRQAAIGVSRNPIDCHAWLDEIARTDHPRHPLRLAFAPWLRALANREFP